MNKNATMVAGILGIVIIIGLIVYFTKSPATDDVVTTVPTTSTNGDVATSPQTPQPSAPSVTTGPDTVPTDTTALITGKVNPGGGFTSYWYQYGATPNLGKETTRQSIGSGYTTISAPGYLTGLTKNTTYYYQLVAENQYGRTMGGQQSVQTTEGTPAPVGTVPTVTTTNASQITDAAAKLNGTVNTNRFTTTYWFEFGKTRDLGNTTDFNSVTGGTITMPVSASLAYLQPGTTYYFRLNAQNQFGTITGTILSFKTSGSAVSPVAPVVQTGNTNAVKATSTTVRANVNPGGAETTYWFEYSVDSLLGSAVVSTDHKSAGSGTTNVSVQANVTGLTNSTVYYYRIVAENSKGTVRGDKLSFETR